MIAVLLERECEVFRCNRGGVKVAQKFGGVVVCGRRSRAKAESSGSSALVIVRLHFFVLELFSFITSRRN